MQGRPKRPERDARVAPRFAVADMGGGDYELALYGEVMDDEPRDWWTGEPTGEQAATTAAINQQMAQLQGAERVTVRLNSCGGDLYAGLAIYSALKNLDADVTVRIEGIAASAASVIACAGDTVIAGPGSIFMVHEGSLGLMGYYTPADLQALMEDARAGVKAMCNVYVDKTHRDRAEIEQMVAAETWLVGREIVAAGFADAYDETAAPEEIEQERDGEAVIAGVAHDMTAFRRVPDLAARVASASTASPATTQETPAAQAVVDMQAPPMAATEEKGERFMNISELREQHPDLVAEIEAAAVKAERDRLAAIDEVAGGIPADMVADAKYVQPCSAEQLALKALKAQASAAKAEAKAERKAAADFLAATEEDEQESGAGDVEAAPTGTDEETEEEQAKKEVQQCAALRAQMKGAIR